MKRRLPDLVCLLALFVLPLALFWQQTLGGRTLIPTENLYQYEPWASYASVVGAPTVPHNHLVSDLVLQNYQWKAFVRQQLGSGEIPLWNPHQFGGIPFLAAGQHSALYPLSLVYYVLDLASAYGWFTVINLWLAGAFMWSLARALGVSRGGAMVAGIVYQLCGFVLASVVFQMMIGGIPWLPLLLWMVHTVLTDARRTLPAVIVGAGALGMNILAGHAEITIYTLVIAGYFAAGHLLVQWWQNRDVRAVLVRGGWLLAMIALGLGLGALQLIPLFDFVRTNWRAERADLSTVLGYAHVPRDLLQFLMPNIYGNPSHHQVFDLFGTRQWVTLDGNPSFHTEWGIKNYVEGALYLGILPLILALIGLRDRWQQGRSTALIFGSLGILSLTFMFGLPTYALIYALPGINQLNSPFRWIYALTVCVAVLAAFGFDRWLVQASSATYRRLGAALCLTGAVLIGLVGLWGLFFPSLMGMTERVFNALTNAAKAFPNATLFAGYSAANILLLAATLVLTGVLFLRARRGGALVQIAAIALISADLLIASWGFNPASDPALLDFTPPVVQAMQAEVAARGQMRYITLEDEGASALLQANALWRYGLDDIRGYDSIIPKPFVDYMRDLAPQNQLQYNRIAPLYSTYSDGFDVQTALASDRLRMLNIGMIVTRSDGAGYARLMGDPQAFTRLFQDASVALFRVNDTLPRAYVCCADAILNRQLATGAVLENALEDIRASMQPASIQSDSGREKFVEVTLPDPRWLVISENYADGWRAFVRPQGSSEDQEKPFVVQAVNGIFQGVQLPAGAWTVRLVYSPTTFQVGLFGTITSVGLLMLLVGMGLWRAFVGSSTASSSTGARVARNSIAPIILNLFNRGIDFAFLLVMLRLLTPEDVGTYYYLVIVFVWFDIFTNFGLDLFLIRAVSRDKTQAGFLFFNTTLLRLLLATVGIGLVVAFIVVRQTAVTPPLSSTALLTLALLYLGLFPASLSKGMSSLFYAFEQAEKPAAIATITTINKAVFGVVVLLLGWDIVGLALVSIFNNLVTLVVLLFVGRSLVGNLRGLRPDVGLMGSMVRQSAPLLMNHFLATIFFQIDVIIIEAFKGATVVAKYSVAYRWISAINIVPSFFTQALLPVMSRQAHEDLEALRRTYTFGIKLMFTLALPTAVLFTFLAVPLTGIMGGQAYLPDGAIALVLMIWSIPIGWMNSLTQYALIALDLQRAITGAFFASVLFNIGLNVLLVPQYSYVAAAITTIGSELVLWLFFAMLMQRGLKTRLNWLALLWRPLIAALAMLVVGWSLAGVSVVIAVVVGAGVYAGVLIALKPLDAAERALFSRMLPARLHPVTRRVGLT